MERSKGQLLELTRCALWGGNPDIALFEEGVNWAEVLHLAKQQTLLGLVATAIDRLPLSLHPTRSDGLRLHQTVTLNRQYRGHQVEVLRQLLDIVERAGVERPVLLKGLGVGLNYPDPALRQCGDIDLYVGEKHYSKVWDFVCDEFSIEKDNIHADHHFDFDFMETHIEIHRYATAPNSVAIRSSEFMRWCESQLEGDDLREVSIDGVKVYLPPYNFDFIYIFYHTWRHFLMGGVGLRQLCDWACYVTAFSDKFDRVELVRLIKRFKLYIPISLLATICVKELGVSYDNFSDFASTTESRYDKVLDKIWSGGNFGVYHKKKRTQNRTVFERKCNSFRSQIDQMKFLYTIDRKYTIIFYLPFFANRIKNAIKQYRTLGDKL